VLDGMHIAALAGALVAVYAGLGGMRDCGRGVSFAPRLPTGLERVVFRVTWRGRCLMIEIRRNDASYSLRDGDSKLEISHWGERIEVVPGAVSTRPLPSARALPAPSQPRGRAPRRRGEVS
jgi:alpha,alpha-trehalose phosphorylase